MKNIFAILLLIIITQSAIAKKGIVEGDSLVLKKKVNYFFRFGMGAMVGCTQCKETGKVASFSASLVHGLRLGKRLSLGTGIGIDSYENWRTMPLFGSINLDLFGDKNKVFVQFNSGYSFAWMNADPNEYYHNRNQDRGGAMINPSLGYRLDYGKMSVSFSIGYKFQRVFSNYTYPYYYPYCPACDSYQPEPHTKETRTDMNRIVFVMVVGW